MTRPDYYKVSEIAVPKTWGMFTYAGNKSLERKAQRLKDDVLKANKELVPELKAFTKYFKSWRRLHNTKTMPESGDTAVRELVWCFAEKIAFKIGVRSALDDIWDRSY